MNGGRHATAGVKLVLTAATAVGIGLLAGCGTASSPAGAGATQGTTSATSAAGGTSAAGDSSSAAPGSASPSTSSAFVPITEPFDPGHPARMMSGPADCASQQTTLAIAQCYEDKTETADAAIDAAQQASFATATVAQQTAMITADQAWLAARPTVCAKAYNTGGTIDQVNIASCLLDESTARLDAVKGVTPPEAALKSSDSSLMSNVSWYTTPEGSRIGMLDTQGDLSGHGVIVAWIIIGGAAGFTVNPAQFFYRDGTFTDAGVIQGASPSGYHVAPGAEYQFQFDYSHLSSDPNQAKGNGGYVYAPGTPAAVWR